MLCSCSRPIWLYFRHIYQSIKDKMDTFSARTAFTVSETYFVSSLTLKQLRNVKLTDRDFHQKWLISFIQKIFQIQKIVSAKISAFSATVGRFQWRVTPKVLKICKNNKLCEKKAKVSYSAPYLVKVQKLVYSQHFPSQLFPSLKKGKVDWYLHL